MVKTTPLVIRLTTVSLVALAISSLPLPVPEPEAAPAKTTPIAIIAAQPPKPAQPAKPASKPNRAERRRGSRRRATTTTTTTTTMDPDDVDFDDDIDDEVDEITTTVITTTIDPRAFDHTELTACDVPLGMESGLIKNESLSASSSYDQSVSPLSARIRTEIRGGAWCPNGLIDSNSRQYLQIDLRREYLITATETQGRFANSVGVEYVESYGIEFWRTGLNRWVKYKDRNYSRVLVPGNSNTYTASKNMLENPFVASKIRFYPYSQHPRTACMRIEVYGCQWKQGIIAYSAPKGGIMQTMAAGALFTDITYDGLFRNGLTYNGLGQMTDSLLGPSDFELLDPTDNKGSRWVGWNRSLILEDYVKIVFNFSDPRIFYHVDLHTNNMFTKDVQLFKEAEVYFSLEGERWQEDYITYEPKQDRVSEHARIIHIDMENRTATHIMFRLKFQHEWILLSEVTFKSTPTTVNASAEFLEEYYKSDTPSSHRRRRYSFLRVSIGLAIAGTVSGLACLITAIIFLTKRARRRIPAMLKKPFCSSLRNQQARNNRRAPRLALALATCPTIHMIKPTTVVDEDYREPYNIWRETLGRRDKLEIQDQHEYNEICEDNDFPRPYMIKRSEPTENFYAATDIIHHTYPEERPLRRERPVPGLFTSIKLPEAEPPNGVAPLLDFPRGRMRPVTFLGEGTYGTLQVCETDGIEELSDEELTDGNRRRLVVVKTLWRGCHNDIKSAFTREATWGAGLKHPQLARVLGLSLQEPPCAALDRGDAVPLPTILRHENKLSYGSLIHICCQISAGMKYLESFELVHRDLSARNVTVTEDLFVKISDYAMFCEEYSSDYHLTADGLRVPLRWMPWESLLQGMFAPSSDVWAFGVTVWEVLTHCSIRPFDEMSDNQVVDNAAEWRCNGRGARVPAAPPPRCRRELYDLMHECWRREPIQRPRFHDLHRFLQRMTQGFKPTANR